jgi:hypothetical protein
MRWFRSHVVDFSWLACFALACQLVLSFGHVHLGTASSNAIAWTVPQGDNAADGPAAPAHKRSNPADDFCAICTNLSLASTLVVPVAPAIEAPFPIIRKTLWAIEETESVRLVHSTFQARGPPSI